MVKTKKNTFIILIVLVALALAIPTVAYAAINQGQPSNFQKTIANNQNNTRYVNGYAGNCGSCINNCVGYVDENGNGFCDIYENDRPGVRFEDANNTSKVQRKPQLQRDTQSQNDYQGQRGNQGQDDPQGQRGNQGQGYCRPYGGCWR